MGLKEELEELRDDTLAKIENAQSSDALEEVRIAVLGKKGSLTAALRSMRELPKEERPVIGKVTNEVRDAVEAALEPPCSKRRWPPAPSMSPCPGAACPSARSTSSTTSSAR